MKKIVCLVIFISIFFPQTSFAMESSPEDSLVTDELIMEQFDKMDTHDLNQIIESINRDLDQYLPTLHLKSLVQSIVRGESVFSIKDLLNGLLKYLFKEVIANSMLLVKLIVIAVLCAFLNNLSNAFESDAVGKLAYSTCYIVIIAIAIQSFSIATKIGVEAIDEMVMFVQALLPILLTLLMTMGGITASALFQPVIIASVGIISTLMKTIVIPLIFFSVILSIVNYLSSKIHVSKLASLLKQVCVILLGLMLTVFIGIITIQGVAASATDGVTIRTAKFAVGLIPVVGGFISDAADAILGCSLILKNAIGGVGLFILAFIVLMPLLKILALILIYKLASALIEPIVDSDLPDCLNDLSNALVMLFGTVLSVAIMFFMAVTMIIGAGNISAMMR
ncbi:stage III sporulation protein AE [Anaerosolibacter carboniphilus]|uniref:Stage III sporulation protein AE n=1 Tax=Anaerosolibacter carboniphilus TaxID=1417629 RepID=A0A841KT83_9FIRM|nr:stage III sporulation protein AE [Anaerosolibacter carboniphilus]MBB6216621.1 stage III sporulation protein AE [Anaerosolibacter carboniphilus]